MPEDKKQASKAAEQVPEDVGFLGNSQKSIPNEKFSLKTGPHSPSAASQIVDARRAQLDEATASLTNDEPKKG